MKRIHNDKQHSTAQHSTAQHSTAQHSTVAVQQYNDFIPVIYASRWDRFRAALTNNILCLLFCGLGIYASLSLGLNEKQINMVILVFLVLYLAWQIRFIIRYQRTFGKKFFNIQVIDYSTCRPLGMARYILREIVEFIFNQTGIGFFSVICAMINKEKRTITDIIFSTIVVERKS